MRAELKFGYPNSRSPFNWLQDSNDSVFGPRFHGGWNDSLGVTAQNAQQVLNEIYFRDPIVWVSAEDSDSGRDAIDASYDLEIDGGGSIQKEGAWATTMDRGSSHTVSVTMENSVDLGNGRTVKFSHWSGGDSSLQKIMHYDPSSVFPGTQDLLDFHAIYRTASADWVESYMLDSFYGITTSWGDFNGDGLDDFYLLDNQNVSHVFLKGLGGYSELNFPGFSGPVNGAEFGDFDNDGDLDLVSIPANNGTFEIFENDGGYFVYNPHQIGSSDADYFSCTFVDVDNDNDLDIVYSGKIGYGAEATWINPGDEYGANWEEDEGGISRFVEGFAWADYNDDNRLDFCALGNGYPGGAIHKNSVEVVEGDTIYFFEHDVGSQIDSVIGDRAVFSANWIDYDGDGDLDFNYNSYLLENDGLGNFDSLVKTPAPC